MNYSESNLVHPMTVIDRINSTSSSNESVCSTSSLNQSYTRQQPQSALTTKSTIGSQQVPQTIHNHLDLNSKTNNYSIRDEASQNYLPKKTQRTKDSFSRQWYQSPRDNV